jgi:hypothetical protein
MKKKIPAWLCPCQQSVKKWINHCQLMSYNMMIGYDIYDRFTMEHFPLRRNIILTTSFFCSRQYIQFAHCSLRCEGCAKLNKEVLEATKKCHKISIRPLRIRLSQLKLQWASCTYSWLKLQKHFFNIFEPNKGGF